MKLRPSTCPRRSCRAGGWRWRTRLRSWLKHPFVVGVVLNGPRPGGPGHHVEVVELVAGWGRNRVIAAGHENSVAVGHRNGLVKVVLVRVDALQRKAALGLEPVVVGLLEQRLLGQCVAVVLVRRIAGPMAGGREDLADEQRLSG